MPAHAAATRVRTAACSAVPGRRERGEEKGGARGDRSRRAKREVGGEEGEKVWRWAWAAQMVRMWGSGAGV